LYEGREDQQGRKECPPAAGGVLVHLEHGHPEATVFGECA
jgi:hypothetical protein